MPALNIECSICKGASNWLTGRHMAHGTVVNGGHLAIQSLVLCWSVRMRVGLFYHDILWHSALNNGKPKSFRQLQNEHIGQLLSLILSDTNISTITYIYLIWIVIL